jgi:hypothetical protein
MTSAIIRRTRKTTRSMTAKRTRRRATGATRRTTVRRTRSMPPSSVVFAVN